jgi:hypothetical protein
MLLPNAHTSSRVPHAEVPEQGVVLFAFTMVH